jgi:hypothetical protein
LKISGFVWITCIAKNYRFFFPIFQCDKSLKKHWIKGYAFFLNLASAFVCVIFEKRTQEREGGENLNQWCILRYTLQGE